MFVINNIDTESICVFITYISTSFHMRSFSGLLIFTNESKAKYSCQIRRIGWVIKILEAQVGQFLLGCKCPVSRGIVQEKDQLGDLPAAFFLQNILQ